MVRRYGVDLNKRVRRYLKKTNDSWRVDETYIKVKGIWMYLYRSVDSEGNTPAYPKAMESSQKAGNLPSGLPLPQIKNLNNMVKQDHRSIKKESDTCSEFSLSKPRQRR